jgi:hypothetical protein
VRDAVKSGITDEKLLADSALTNLNFSAVKPGREQ